MILILALNLVCCWIIGGSFFSSAVVALQMMDPLMLPLLMGRREVLKVTAGAGVGAAATTATTTATTTIPVIADTNSDKEQGTGSRLIEWSPPSEEYAKLRYSSSSLLSERAVVPKIQCTTLPVLPHWMEGNWFCTYQFAGASFPQGRDKLSLQVPGAGLGTCAVLPNVGISPKAPFLQRFINSASDSDSDTTNPKRKEVVEDVAANLPRKFEAFWPQAKVTAIRVSIPGNNETVTDKSDSSSGTTTVLSPLCVVTGEGCTPAENPQLHGKYATRCRMEFQGPTTGVGIQAQQFDVSMVDYESEEANTTTTTTATTTNDKDAVHKRDEDNDEEFLMSRTFVQYNVEQELTLYYREFVSYRREKQEQEPTQEQTNVATTTTTTATPRVITGRTRVAAFLPPSPQAVALYSYTMKYEASTNEDEV